jgi:hypothetical protein
VAGVRKRRYKRIVGGTFYNECSRRLMFCTLPEFGFGRERTNDAPSHDPAYGGKNLKLSPDKLYALRQDLEAVSGEKHTADLCYCGCHYGRMVHDEPCCRPCEVCGKNVRLEAYENHIARHNDDRDATAESGSTSEA